MILKTNLQSLLLLFSISLIITNSVSHAGSQNLISDARMMEEIERSMIFSSENNLKITDDGNEGKSSITVSVNDTSDEESESSTVEVVIFDPKSNDQMLRKQKLAYSATLIGQYEVAIELYKQLLKQEPDNNYLKFALATSYHSISQYQQAKNLYYELIKSNYENKNQAIGNLLEIIIQESPNDAVYLLAKLSSQNPNSAAIIARSAMAYDQIGKEQQAITLLRRAINIDPKQIEYKFNLAVIYDKQGSFDKALQLYNEVIRSYRRNNQSSKSIPISQIKKRAEFIRNQG